MACDEARRWHAAGAGRPPLTVAVNLSARQFEPGDLTAVVEDCWSETGLDPSCLHLELTETAIIDLRPDILRAARAHQGSRRRRSASTTSAPATPRSPTSAACPLSFVKIDQSFVQGLGTNQEDERIVAAVVDLAANLGLRSIAEGVETQDQLDRLRELGCDQAQGYLFARPLPPNDVSMDLLNSAW